MFIYSSSVGFCWLDADIMLRPHREAESCRLRFSVPHRAEELQMAVRSNEMETTIDAVPTVRPTAAWP